jgi:RNA exonuclease 1
MGSKRKNRASHYAPRPESASTALPPLTSADVPAFNLTAGPLVAMELSPAPFRTPTEDDTSEWELPGRNKKPKKEKATKKRNYPEFVVSPQRLRRPIVLKDLQGLGLWLSADGAAPQWLLVRHKPEIRRVVVLMVPGFTTDMFDGTLDLDFEKDGETKKVAEDMNIDEDYFPTILETWKLAPCVRGMAEMFTHVWPIRAAGDDRYNTLHSPITSFLTAVLPKNTDITQATGGNGKRLNVTQLLMSLEELVENEYPLHSSQTGDSEEEKTLLEKRKADGWVETDLSKGNGEDHNQAGSILDGKTIYSIDCEMCQTEYGLELTRISVIDWDGTVVYDTLVKPGNEIIDYLTM